MHHGFFAFLFNVSSSTNSLIPLTISHKPFSLLSNHPSLILSKSFTLSPPISYAHSAPKTPHPIFRRRFRPFHRRRVFRRFGSNHWLSSCSRCRRSPPVRHGATARTCDGEQQHTCCSSYGYSSYGVSKLGDMYRGNICHVEADGRSFNHFMKAWASIFRSGRNSAEFCLEKSMPWFDRNAIKEKDPCGLESMFCNECLCWASNWDEYKVPVHDLLGEYLQYSLVKFV